MKESRSSSWISNDEDGVLNVDIPNFTMLVMNMLN